MRLWQSIDCCGPFTLKLEALKQYVVYKVVHTGNRKKIIPILISASFVIVSVFFFFYKNKEFVFESHSILSFLMLKIEFIFI